MVERINKKSNNIAVILMRGFNSLDIIVKEMGLNIRKFNKNNNTLKSDSGIVYYFYSNFDGKLEQRMSGMEFRKVIGK
jgi:hypothetical protein